MSSALVARRHVLASALFAFGAIAASAPSYALNGVDPLQIFATGGWKAFEILTQGDDVSGVAAPGYGSLMMRGEFDGTGPLREGATIVINLNHEQVHAAITRLELSRNGLRQAVASKLDAGVTPFPTSFVTGIDYAYQAIYPADYHAVASPDPVASGAAVVGYGDAHFYRLCSGTMDRPAAFGAGRGFVDAVYLVGEEAEGPDGQFFALDPATRTLWEVPAIGRASWENAAQLDTGDAIHVALVLTSDYNDPPGDYLRLYVGTKGVDANGDGMVDFLERNGLRGGAIYYFKPDGAATATDLPDGTVVGTWSPSSSGALRDTKIEDVHVNPLDGRQAVFAASHDGIYRLDATLKFNAVGILDSSASPAVIAQIWDDDVAPIGEPDNVLWAANGTIYVQEDNDGDEVHALNPDGSGRALIATAASEPSGIEDISALVGYQPGSVLIATAMGGGTSGAQLAVMVSPTAARLPSSADFNGDGHVDGADLLVWQRGLGLVGAADLSSGDANFDGAVDAADLAIWKSQQGEAAARATHLVAEPATGSVAAASAIALLFARRNKKGRDGFLARRDLLRNKLPVEIATGWSRWKNDASRAALRAVVFDPGQSVKMVLPTES